MMEVSRVIGGPYIAVSGHRGRAFRTCADAPKSRSEGTRGEPGVKGDYKPGVAALYRELGLACHPVATNSGVHWPAHGFLRRPGTIVFEYPAEN